MMDQIRRELMHTVIDGLPDLIPIAHQLSHYTSCDCILKWLIRNKITGKTFQDWIKVDHDNSVLAMVKFIIKSYNKSREDAPIILNKDWIQ